MSGRTPEAGALGLPFTEVGETVQSLLSVLVDRGHRQELVVASLREAIAAGRFDEGDWWFGRLGTIVDELADELELERYPDDESARAPRELGVCSLCRQPVLDSQEFGADGRSRVYHEECPEVLDVCETCSEPIGEDEAYVIGRSIATEGGVLRHEACARPARVRVAVPS